MSKARVYNLNGPVKLPAHKDAPKAPAAKEGLPKASAAATSVPVSHGVPSASSGRTLPGTNVRGTGPTGKRLGSINATGPLHSPSARPVGKASSGNFARPGRVVGAKGHEAAAKAAQERLAKMEAERKKSQHGDNNDGEGN